MLPEVDRLLLIWRRVLLPPTRRVQGAALVAALFGAARLARAGTAPGRIAAAVLFGSAVLGVVTASVLRKRRGQDMRWVLREVVGGADPEQGQRAERAFGLLERSRQDPTAGSSELAQLHLSRQIARVSPDAVKAAAERRARVRQGTALVLAAGALGLVFMQTGAFDVVEGLNVMASRGHRAPVDLSYLHGLRVEVQPPDYLREKSRVYVDEASLQAPYGSLVTFRGALMHTGRQLALSDGKVEIPFTDDGTGKLSARWPLKESVQLDVVARLGEVRIAQGEPVSIESIPDQSPEVVVENAPRTAKLLDTVELPVLYRATDDHGLREVDLVLRAGTREERRVLARLDGETRHDEGGYQLRGSDVFLRQAYLPVEVTVEARDNDPLTGPKWGRSQAIILLPPAIGEPEALRHEAMLATRAALVDLLAGLLAAPEKSSPAALSELHQRWLAPVTEATQRVSAGVFGGLKIPRRTGMFVDAQLRKVTDALAAERKSPGARAHADAVRVVEGVVLAADRVSMALGTRDAQSVAKRLSRVALDAADQLGRSRQKLLRESEGKQRVEAAMQVLEPSGQALSRLGALGADLGSIVANDLRRLRRALGANDLHHAELVAYDLGLRLLKANPSFAGGAGKSTGEGGGQGKGDAADEAAGGEGEGDGEEASFDAEQQALQELMRDHAGNVENTQQEMRKASEGAQPDDFREEARRHAQAVREAMRGLPGEGDGDSASEARSQAERMAQALERGDAREAIEAARAAERSLSEGAQAERQVPDPTGKMIADSLDAAGRRLAPERRWAEDVYQKMQQAARQGANLKDAAERESRLADRTRDLARQGQGERGNLPPQALDHLQQAEQAMRDAARAMAQGNGDEALELQRKAQHHLDSTSPQDDSPSEPPPSDREGNREGNRGRPPSTGPAAIPKADDHRSPNEFRKRVTEGLKQGQPPGLRDAVRRYAERLLK